MWCRQTDIEVRNSWVFSEGCWVMDVFVPEVNVSYLSSISTSLTAQVLIRFTGSGPLTESKNKVIFHDIFVAKPETYFLCINKATNLIPLQKLYTRTKQLNERRRYPVRFRSLHLLWCHSCYCCCNNTCSVSLYWKRYQIDFSCLKYFTQETGTVLIVEEFS